MPQVITTILLDDNPNGLRSVVIDNWSGRAFIIPRGKLNEAQELEKMQHPGIYFLFGEGTDAETLYIGKSDNLSSRLSQQNSDREIEAWNMAIVFADMPSAFPEYLESKSIKLAREANRYEVVNEKNPKKDLDEHQRIAAETYFRKIEIVLPLFGYKVFDRAPTQQTAPNIYVFSQSGAIARGSLLGNNKEFVVFKGSTARKKEGRAYPKSSARLRRELIDKNILKEQDDEFFVFSEDYIFDSPSGAANIVSGVASNGWRGWKDEQGKTLDENERRK